MFLERRIKAFLTPFASAHLIAQLSKREIRSRFSGSVLGGAWILLAPLLMFAVYTFIFGVVFRARWPGASGDPMEFAIRMFAGLILFSFFAEVLGRAPKIILENPNLVKKVRFPLEILTIVSMCSAAVSALVSFALLLVFVVLVRGEIFATIFLAPVVLAPLVLTTAGLGWLLAALGVYFRDLGQIVGVAVSALLFLTPIFYPVSAVPDYFQTWMHLNPLTAVVESFRGVVVEGQVPSPLLVAASIFGSLVVYFAGFSAFSRLRDGFADAL